MTEGIICLISAVESCYSFQVRVRNSSGRIELFRRERKCLHHYLYLIDPEFGLMHVRMQGWIPYDVQIYINGREWLCRALDRAGIGYVRYDNSLLAIDDLEAASKLCDDFAHKAWPRVLNAFARKLNPLLPAIRRHCGGYYWCLDQAEIATDVMFKTRPELLRDLARPRAPRQLEHVLLRRAGLPRPQAPPSLQAQVVTDASRRPEGWRVRHRVAGNWVKVYDKASVLRVETTINNPREFRILRVVTDPEGRRERRWCPMRKGVSDLWRSYQVGIAANRRYLEALAAAPMKGEGVAALDALCRPRTNRGRRHARFNPLNPTDLALFRAALAGEHTIRGFGNGDITRRLYRRPPADLDEAHRRCERVSTTHRQTPRPRPHRQDPTRSPLPRHPLRLPGHDRRDRHARRQLRRALPGGGIKLRDTCLPRHANLAGNRSIAGSERYRADR